MTGLPARQRADSYTPRRHDQSRSSTAQITKGGDKHRPKGSVVRPHMSATTDPSQRYLVIYFSTAGSNMNAADATTIWGGVC